MKGYARLQFVIADAGRARWVRRSDPFGAYETIRVIERPEPVRSGPEGVVFESWSGHRATAQPHTPAAVRERAIFAETISDELDKQVAGDPDVSFALVAPPRVLVALETRLTARVRAAVLGQLAKDLTKTPDAKLGAWLGPLERQAGRNGENAG